MNNIKKKIINKILVLKALNILGKKKDNNSKTNIWQ